MQKMNQAIMLSLLLMTGVFVASSCKKPCKATYTYSYFEPVYRAKAEVKANIKSNAPRAITNPGKIYQYGNYLFLNEVGKGIHVIDNGNPAAPVNKSFISIPGNVDIAIKGGLLYADLYADLVVMDIANPMNVVTKSFVDKVFPNRYYGYFYRGDSSSIIAEWVLKTETVSYDCEENPMVKSFANGCFVMDGGANGSNNTVGAGANAVPTGIAGSLARFALVDNYLYAVSDEGLHTFSLMVPHQPLKTNTLSLPWGVETIYPFQNKLFIGSTTGMHVCDLQLPSAPRLAGTFSHVRSCDPVIADGSKAYVTLRGGGLCGGNSNQLDVLDIANINAPQLLKSYPLTSPMGLGKDGNLLFVCDGNSGVRVFNAANPLDLKPITTLQLNQPMDVIAYNGIALVVANAGLYQYDYTNPNQIKWLSTIPVTK